MIIIYRRSGLFTFLKVLGYIPASRTKALVMHINIRKKFELQSLDGIKLQAVSGVGYNLVDMFTKPE